uniref:Ig-like domain-containing protein n=1 Tax=Kwoniella bestiolae CBS 10118 TaxID=1296100 RepID=A0A1B9G7S4_9TREE|nr:hypothetical protein I302_01920 [Kwoniella bestiolae CBS 10118]OCF27085.1 hypothetical protein I302_01920 [Kwoniella bestiolae CBS 10118]
MSLNLSIILLLSTIIGFGVAQSTVPTGNGLSFQCPTNPSPIPAFAAGYCASSLTHKTGAQWPLMSEVVTVTYSQAPGSYFSNAAGDIYLVCNWQDPAGAINNFGCRYNAGAATGDSFAAGLQYNAGGTGFNQKCPVIQAKKPIPSPGLQYRKRLLPATKRTAQQLCMQ